MSQEESHGFFLDNFSLIMRNWEKFLKYPILFNIPIDFTRAFGFGGLYPLGALVMAWKTIPDMVSECGLCHGSVYFIPWGYSDYIEREFTYHCTSCGKTWRDNGEREYKKHGIFLDRVDHWRNCEHWTPSNMNFKRAIELLKQSEIDKEDSWEFWGRSKDTDNDIGFLDSEPIDVDHLWWNNS